MERSRRNVLRGRAALAVPVSIWVGIAGCHRSASTDAGPDGSQETRRDVGSEAEPPRDVALEAGALDDGGPALPPWPRELPAARVWGEAGGRRAARVIVHAHSVHSHDACDNAPYIDGGVNEPCLVSLRTALCHTRVDAVFLTEHAALLAQGPFERSMQLRPGDAEETEDGARVAYSFACPDAHRVLVIPGAENELMPLALRAHPQPLSGRTLEETYRSASLDAVARFRGAGGFVVLSHAEQKSVDLARSLRPDGTELYNVHANLDPRIAGPFLGVDIGEFFVDVPRFTNEAFRTEPDLLFLGLFRENVPDLVRWSALWRDGQRVVGLAGSDAHENAIPRRLSDGERGDSYRRIFRWFSNELMVEGPFTRRSLLAALAASRARVRFEAWGVAEGFRWTLATADGDGGRDERVADGERASLAERVTLEVVAPTVHALDPSLPAPAIRVSILRANGDDPTGWTEVASDARLARHTPLSPGVFRAEARITPHHAGPYLPRLERYVREVPWIYSAPTVVTE
jgi:hypothetical protein